MLLQRYCSLLEQGWRQAFAQRRSQRRALQHAVALLCSLGRRTISRTLCLLGRAQQDWSADYRLFSRSGWKAETLFDPVIEHYLAHYRDGPIAVALDDTKLRKTGRKIESVSWQRDPMSPPFRVNFMLGLRFLQASLLFPHYREGDFSARGFPIQFQEAPSVKKPGKRASDEQVEQYRQARKTSNLSTQTRQLIVQLRVRLDDHNAQQRPLLAVLDGSFCNRTLFKNPPERVVLLARCRKDARLCWPAPNPGRRKYDARIFTPEDVRQNEQIEWQIARIHFGGEWRSIRYKELNGILWKRGAGTRSLRLIVVAPQPYKPSPHARTYYRQPGYLLCTDNTLEASQLIQPYFDRWQIEVNHRDEKSILGVGQAQVRSSQSVPRHPAFAVASYSLLLLAAWLEFGPGRSEQFVRPPKWRKNTNRPSLLDLITLLRQEAYETSVSINETSAPNNETSVSQLISHQLQKNLINYAYT